jgi:hypothetical protein
MLKNNRNSKGFILSFEDFVGKSLSESTLSSDDWAFVDGQYGNNIKVVCDIVNKYGSISAYIKKTKELVDKDTQEHKDYMRKNSGAPGYDREDYEKDLKAYKNLSKLLDNIKA